MIMFKCDKQEDLLKIIEIKVYGAKEEFEKTEENVYEVCHEDILYMISGELS